MIRSQSVRIAVSMCLLFTTSAALSCAAEHSSPLSSPSSTTSDARSGIQSAYDGLSAAFERRDLDTFMTYFTPDYTEADAKGVTTDKAGARRHYQDQLNRITTMHNRYSIQTLTPTINGEQVEMAMHSDGTGFKRILFARFTGTFTNDLVVHDLWVETPQGWRLKYRQTVSNETHIHPR